MKKRLFYLEKINIAKVLVLGYIFIMSLFVGGAIVEATTHKPDISIESSTYTGNARNNAVQKINNIPYIQGTGKSNEDGITFKITNAYVTIDDYTAIAVWEQGFSSSALEYEDYDRWYINTIPCESEAYATCAQTLNSSADRDLIARKNTNPDEYVTYGYQKKLYYIVESHNNKDSAAVTTVADFTHFFDSARKEILYTYRIRNHKSSNNSFQPSFGFKEIYINFWKAKEGDSIVSSDVDKATTIKYGLAQPISDVGAHTNFNDSDYSDTNPVACHQNQDKICIDYVDSNGVPSESTTIEHTANIYIPNTVIYEHKYTTTTSIKDSYKDPTTGALTSSVTDGNTIYALNYFCEGTNITPAKITGPEGSYTISCDDGELRKYLYVDSRLIGNDIHALTSIPTTLTEYFLSARYNTTMTVDTRGNYIVVVKDKFGNTNSKAVIKVQDIINQAILAYFQKSNAKEDVLDIDGWKAGEYVTNQSVQVSIAMSATTIIKIGLPIDAAETTLLNRDYVKEIRYWRVDLNGDYETDICQEDSGNNCAMKPLSDSNSTRLYYKESTTSSEYHGDGYESFNDNIVTLSIGSNGRYRFYIETFAGSNTDHDGTPLVPGNPIKGEQKNPRVEIYKIDKLDPEVLFGGDSNAKCGATGCNHSENTYTYYQGTGNPSSTIIDKLYTGSEPSIKIDYGKKLIYYVSANGGDPIYSSANNTNDDFFFEYIDALIKTDTYFKDSTINYSDVKTLHGSAYTVAGPRIIEYKLEDENFENLDTEEKYRKYILANDIKFTAYSLSVDQSKMTANEIGLLDVHNVNVEYLDASDGVTPICQKLEEASITLGNLGGVNTVDPQDCVNYYLDHAIDFYAKITIWDVIEELLRDGDGNITGTKNILGNYGERTILIDVVDTTAPGFNELLNRYNVGTDCRVELGNMIGGSADQDVNMLLNCYGVTTKTGGGTPITTYNFEDNVFNGLTQNQVINTSGYVDMYILSQKDHKWVNLKNGYTPDRSGNYAVFIVIHDNAGGSTTFNFIGKTYHEVNVVENLTVAGGNAIGVLVTYHVDKKIVLVSPENNEKRYGETDPIFSYCVSINKNTLGIKEYLEAPFKDMSVFTEIGCAEYNTDETSVSLNETKLQDLFKGNYGKAYFDGILTRQESAMYNNNRHENESNIANNYVGLYKIVLGTLTIAGEDDGYDLGEDYIVKINPNNRSEGTQLNKGLGKQGEGRCNLVASQEYTPGQYVDLTEDGYTTCYPFDEDDDLYVESKSIFTIKQAILVVQANGDSKEYGTPDVGDISDSPTIPYLNGYTILSGLKSDNGYNDTPSVVLGALRRQVGESVGVYSICNYRGTTLADNALESINNMLILNDGNYTKDCGLLDPLSVGGDAITDSAGHINGILDISLDYIKSRALYIETNKIDAATKYKTLNTTNDLRNNNYANYVIKYQANIFNIEPAKMIVQPAPGQRREYGYLGVDDVNPWEIIVYGEKTFSPSANETFNGFTEHSPSFDKRRSNDYQSVDTPDAELDQEHYANASEERAADGWKLVQGAITYDGKKTNETYSLFVEGKRLVLKPNGVFALNNSSGLYENMNAGWYAFDVLDPSKSNLEIIGNGRYQCTVSNAVGSGTGYETNCKNYDLSLDLNYRNEAGYKNGDVVGTDTVEVVYKSKDKYCMKKAYMTDDEVSDLDVQCHVDIADQILFEVYRREIILEFNSMLEKVPSNDAHLVYGYRYNFYQTNLFEIAENSANKNYLENYLFYCYPFYSDGLVGLASGTNTCTANPWYGLTSGDSWVNVGLKFYLHSVVSDANSGYYADTGKAIPAGRYYVYSEISDDAALNYKYTYLGGTLTIKTKTVGITITDYSKEYGNVYYTNPNPKCILDGSLLLDSNDLISDCLLVGSEATSNNSNNTYGFTINELDNKDTIADNFVGRPKRDTKIDVNVDENGLQENVGVYTIGDGSIKSKHNNSFTTCSGNFIPNEGSDCVVVDGVEINNYMVNNDADYDLTYYLIKNGTGANGKDYSYVAEDTTIINPGNKTVDEGSLKITPATIEIEVEAGQTKMYGCAYNVANTVSEYSYTYADGYGCVPVTAAGHDDLGYKYTVKGDKDYYIYNTGYYSTDYDYNNDIPYTTDRVNQITQSSTTLLLPTSRGVGYRSSALNGGVLYRVRSDLYGSGISYSSIIAAANAATDTTADTLYYQGQKVGNYIITLGNLNATLTSEFANYDENNNMVCDSNNQPGMGSEVCRNYIISYHGASSIEDTHVYSENEDDLVFTITTRVAFVYAFYNAKVYGNNEPVVTISCDANKIAAGVCHDGTSTLTLGITEYYAKFNSLAKAPYVASIEAEDDVILHEYDTSTLLDDKQVDVLTGTILRKGMNNGDWNKDDIVGVYNYIYDVDKTSYAESNYVLNFYYRDITAGFILIKDGAIDDVTNPYILDDGNYDQYMAVNENGTTDEVVDGVDKKVYFEINLRKINVKLINFSKVYGIQDDSTFFNLGICATADEVLGYDGKGNPICSFDTGVTSTEHGLSPSHKAAYISDGTLNQALFKQDFGVRFVRSLGENVACPSKNVSATINGYFTDRATSYTYDLGCVTYSGVGKAYEALGIIDQSDNTKPGYNYEITYESGDMLILPRTIEITPDSGQGFQYGSYTYPTLIPAITFTNKLVNSAYVDATSTRKIISYKVDATRTVVKVINKDGTSVDTAIEISGTGLVNGGATRICLINIDAFNKFCINDQQDTYDVDNTEKSTSRYEENVNGEDANFTTHVFGDTYENENSARSALNRVALGFESQGYQRYNRNVGVYTIVKGDDFADKSGNYRINFTEGRQYIIEEADITITPTAGQSKIYGEADKQLSFSVLTTYTINSTQYVKNDGNIKSIVDVNGVVRDPETYTGEEYISVTKGSTIVLYGYAYSENAIKLDGSVDELYNYGLIKNSNKSGASAAITQSDVVGASFDKYCYNDYVGVGVAGEDIVDCHDREVSHTATTKILVGYLYVTDYIQRAGTYKIAKGVVVSDNEFNTKNYELNFNETIDFEIIKLTINVYLNDISKIYGEATDSWKCDQGVASCVVNGSILTANDNEEKFEYNFDVSYVDSAILAEGTYDGDTMVLLVSPKTNGAGDEIYYTQSEGREDKNNFLGISVIRKNNNNTTCSVDTDIYGCEDAGKYDLYLRKYSVILAASKDGSNRYDENYDLNISGVSAEFETLDNTSNEYIVVDPVNRTIMTETSINVIKDLTGELEIRKREVDIYVNTNLNVSEDAKYFEIQQNIEVPTLPSINNDYNLTGYAYDEDKYHYGTGENASSTSDDPYLYNTYEQIVWGGQPQQVRKDDALVGEVAYCNQPRDGTKYLGDYPTAASVCNGDGEYVYNDSKEIVNTSTDDVAEGRFIIIARDTGNLRGLKIRPDPDGALVSDNDYETKNYDVTFYPGAVHVVNDDKDPILVIGNKDYYIEANASYDNGNIIGSQNNDFAILEYLTGNIPGSYTGYVLANVDSNGNLYITLADGTEVAATQSGLRAKWGARVGFPGIVSGIEQREVYPFISNYAHGIEAAPDTKIGSYMNQENILLLEELITTLIEWFDVDSYDNGQIVNGVYLPRKFDRYYYIAINKNGYDIANDIDNEFAINKVGTYDIAFYVMDNSGKVSADGNIARLHIIDTTAPTLGELNLYSGKVKCDFDCDLKDKWYINETKIRLSSFNRYTKEVDDASGAITFVLDPKGDFIYFAELGNDLNPYVLIDDLRNESGRITTEGFVDYINIEPNKQYYAHGIIHYTWDSSPNGIYLTITGGGDNSYTVRDDSKASQWQHYYSLDEGNYWVDYETTQYMEGKIALISDGERTIKSMTSDYGIDISESGSLSYTFTYSSCYGDCVPPTIVNKFDVGTDTYSFYDSQIENRSFEYNADTHCEINKMGTLITCDENGTITKVKLQGNKFTYRGTNYIILGNNVFNAESKEFITTIKDYSITIPNAAGDPVTYRYDQVAGIVYREYIGIIKNEGVNNVMTLESVEYVIEGLNIKLRSNGNLVATINEEENKFELNGREYKYFVSKGDSYYYSYDSYVVYQDSFKLNPGDPEHTFTGEGSINIGGGNDVLTIKSNKRYNNTYTLYDKYLKGLDNQYRDSMGGAFAALELPEEMIIFSNQIIENNVAWNEALPDNSGSINEELSKYLNKDEDSTLYYLDEKRAYLDTVAPVVGITMYNGSDVVRYGNGNKLFTYEYGYFNTTRLNAEKKYNLRGNVFTVNVDLANPDNSQVIGPDGATYKIHITNDADPNKYYSYVINYVTYYIDSAIENIYWLPSYVDSYVGVKDTAKNEVINTSEVPIYNLFATTKYSDLSLDSRGSYDLMSGLTQITSASGIGENEYKTSGDITNLHDFIKITTRGAVYHEDIDYIISYIDPDTNILVKEDLSEEFEACYYETKQPPLNPGYYISQDCAQKEIAKVVKPRGTSNKDITYDIFYVVRDKAGNASQAVAKGVIYATIIPSTNIIIQNIEPTPTNSGVAALSLGNNTYSLTANQGVSLLLLDEAFSLDYIKTSTGKNYNDEATMTIYKNEEMIADHVKGVNFIDYVSTNEIAEYKIVYNLVTKHTPIFGDDITVNGEEVTLYLNINSPKVEELDKVPIDDFVGNYFEKNETSKIGITLVIGFIFLFSVLLVMLILRKRR